MSKLKKLNKKQRHSIYVKALEFYTNDPTRGFCFHIRDAIINLGYSFYIYYSDMYFYEGAYPELLKHKPKKIKKIGIFWFPIEGQSNFDPNIRINILKQAIEETK